MSSSSLNLYDVTVPQIIHTLKCLSKILQKATTQSSTKSLSHTDLLEARLAPDMFPLPVQIQIACNTAKFIPVRVAGVENVAREDNEKTFDDLQERIQFTIGFLEKVKREDFEGKEGGEVAFRDYKFTGVTYVCQHALPTFFFHVVTAYDILRMKGIDVGKVDYLGPIKPGETF